jgi:plasmid stabilization system protein ParE
MIRQVRHPLVRRDVIGIFEHVMESTQGDPDAAERRLDEIDVLLADIAADPASGVRLDGRLAGWLVRHGRRQRITIVFRPDPRKELVHIALIAFGGRDWMAAAAGRGSPEV